jgi:hypothetical protein
VRSAGTDGRPLGFLRQSILFTLFAIFPFIIVGCSTGQPDEIDLAIWSRHDAHRFCAPAIAAYPDVPAPPCFAMHMCANEAVLNSSQSKKLLEMIAKTEGCEEP